MGDAGGFWGTIGPYLGGAIVILIGVIFSDLKSDLKWLKRNVTVILAELKIKPEGD